MINLKQSVWQTREISWDIKKRYRYSHVYNS